MWSSPGSPRSPRRTTATRRRHAHKRPAARLGLTQPARSGRLPPAPPRAAPHRHRLLHRHRHRHPARRPVCPRRLVARVRLPRRPDPVAAAMAMMTIGQRPLPRPLQPLRPPPRRRRQPLPPHPRQVRAATTTTTTTTMMTIIGTAETAAARRHPRAQRQRPLRPVGPGAAAARATAAAAAKTTTDSPTVEHQHSTGKESPKRLFTGNISLGTTRPPSSDWRAFTLLRKTCMIRITANGNVERNPAHLGGLMCSSRDHTAINERLRIQENPVCHLTAISGNLHV